MTLHEIVGHIRPVSSAQETTKVASHVLSGRSKKGLRAKLLPFLGLAFIAGVAYMGPW